MFVCKTCKDIIDVLEFLKEAVEKGDIRIAKVSDRFSSPTSAGWSDIAVYFFMDMDNHPECEGLVMELQVVHHQLYVVRKDLRAHQSYEKDRFCSELAALLKKHLRGQLMEDFHSAAFEQTMMRLPYSQYEKSLSAKIEELTEADLKTLQAD